MIYLHDLEHLDGQENYVNAARVINIMHRNYHSKMNTYTNIIFETISTEIEVGKCGKHAVISQQCLCHMVNTFGC